MPDAGSALGFGDDLRGFAPRVTPSPSRSKPSLTGSLTASAESQPQKNQRPNGMHSVKAAGLSVRRSGLKPERQIDWISEPR
jgi:hypothetical protein